MRKDTGIAEEITIAIVKILLVLWVIAGVSYIMYYHVGREEGQLSIDLVWGFFSGAGSTILSVFIKEKLKDKDKDKEKK